MRARQGSLWPVRSLVRGSDRIAALPPLPNPSFSPSAAPPQRYVPPPSTSSASPEAEKVRIEGEVHRLVTSRDKKYTNFIEYNNYKLIYRRYAGLFFTIAVDINDNELSYLETIHLFVELLDSYFSNVCELDIVFNFNKVYSILDEYILAGEIEETSKKEILDRVKFLEKME